MGYMSSQKAELQKFRKEKYQLDEATGFSLLQEDAKSDLHNSVNIISEQLYSKDVHFVFELIQNAEDNHYADGVTPKLHFELLEHDPTGTEETKGCLAIFNNELGFNINNIKAVSSIGKSTKAGSKDAGYIGEKGIGFKSVFSVSPSPHIFSNGYHFLFKDKDDVAGLGYIIPYWVDNISKIVQERMSTYTTCILLPLRADSDRDIQQKIRHELNNLDASILLFLNKINELTVEVDGTLRCYSKLVDGKVTTLLNQQDKSTESVDYLVSKKTVDVPVTLVEAKREGVVKRDICIAYRKNFKPEDKMQHKLYAYLPTELNTGLPFLVNADFLLPASRESVLVDKPWNDWMCKEVATFVADTLAELLQEDDNVDYFSQIPYRDNCTEDFLLPIYSKIIEKLGDTAFIPSLSGLKNKPGNICFADKDVTKLLVELRSDEHQLSDRVAAIDVHPYKKVLEQFCNVNLDAEEILSYLNSAQTVLMELPEAWFVSLLRWLSKQEDRFHWKSDEDGIHLLHKAPLFITDKGVMSCHEHVLFLSSSTYIEYPVLTTPEHKTDHGLISQSFQEKLRKEPGLLSFIENYFDIEILSQSEYLDKVALPFCKEYLSDIKPNALWQLNCFVVQHWFSLKDDTKKQLIDGLPFKNHLGSFELKGNKRLVTPASDEQSFIWQTVFNTHEQEHFLILSDEYLSLLESFEKIDKYEFYRILNITAAPLPLCSEVKKVDRYGPVSVGEGDFTSQYESYLEEQIKNIDSTLPICLTLFTLPSICRDNDAFLSKDKRTAFSYWLVSVAERLLSQIRVDYYYRTYLFTTIESELSQWLKENKWLPTQNGLKRPSEVFIASQGSRELYGNAVSFLDDDFVLGSLAERLGIATEVNTDTVLKVLRSWSEHNDKVNPDDVMKLYDRLANTGANLNSLFAEEALIYCPSGETNWCKSSKAIWKSQKAVLGSLFHWLSDIYPDHKMSFWLNVIGVSQHPDPKSFADAWLHLQTLPVNEKDKTKNVRNKLAIIYERLISYIKGAGTLNLEPWFGEFVKNAHCFTQAYQWKSRDSVYISDDRRVAKLFEGEVDFFWRTRSKTHSDFFPLYDALCLKGVSEKVHRKIELDLEDLDTPIKPILTEYSRLLLAYYYKQLISKSGTIAKDWYKNSEIFNLLTVREYYTSSNITVEYDLDDSVSFDDVEVFFDNDTSILVYNINDKDNEELIDDLAEEISKLIVTKAFIEEQDHIRPLLNINSLRRFNKRVEKKHWESVLTKEEINIIKSLQRAKEQSEYSVTDNAEFAEDEVITDSGNQEKADIEARGNCEIGCSNNVDSSSKFKSELPEAKTKNETSDSLYFASQSEHQHEATSCISGRSKRSHFQTTDDCHSHSTGGPHNKNVSTGTHTASNGTRHSNGSDFLNNEGNDNSEDMNNHFPRTPSYRMVSYVENNGHQPKDDYRKKQRAKSIGDKAESIVADYLRSEGCVVEHLGGNNPGFDISATDVNTGETFLVEVKGTLGNWNLMGFSLSKTQMQKCQDYGDNYWLFVVENLMNKPQLYKLVNPAAQIDVYCFDSNWKYVAEEIVLSNSFNESIDLRSSSALSKGNTDIIDDDFFYCEKHKGLYQKCTELAIGTPEVGFELQDPYDEIVCELELAWPKFKKGVYTGKQKPIFDGWEFKTVDEVLLDLIWLNP